MVIIEDLELGRAIEEAFHKVKDLSIPILVSQVQQVHQIDPLSFFAIGKSKFEGERFFWKQQKEDMFLVGLGKIQEIINEEDENRYFSVDKKWKDIIHNSIVINPYKHTGMGPMIFGGFTFDPLKKKTERWSKFFSSHFYVPKYLLSVVHGETYLTTNIIISNEHTKAEIDGIIRERNSLLSHGTQPFSSTTNKVIKQVEIGVNEWKNSVHFVVNHIKEGETKKVVLARELRLSFEEAVSVETTIQTLLREQKDSYIFAFEVNGDCFLGATPERLVKRTGNKILSTSLAGSIRRGETVEEDEQLGKELLNDPKNLIEHQYVVDMIRDAMEKVCKKVNIPDGPTLMKVRDIQHLYTPVEGVARVDSSLLEATKLLHPTPALGGFPKDEAVKKIREVEKMDRGFYGAPIGWMDYNGDGEFIVAIRSALIQGKEASLFAGCGIVEDSDVESEYVETSIKFRPMLSALGGIEK